jgi:hypothetical protein
VKEKKHNLLQYIFVVWIKIWWDKYESGVRFSGLIIPCFHIRKPLTDSAKYKLPVFCFMSEIEEMAKKLPPDIRIPVLL